MKNFALVFSLFVVLLAACDPDEGGSGKTLAQLETDWGAHCDDYATRCPERANEPAECKQDFPCFAKVMRLDMLDKMIACQSERTCTEGDDPCFDLNAQGLQPSDQAAKLKTDCLAKKASCEAADEPGFSDDYCFVALSMNDELVGKLATCVDKACGEVGDCMETTIETASPACQEGDQ